MKELTEHPYNGDMKDVIRTLGHVSVIMQMFPREILIYQGWHLRLPSTVRLFMAPGTRARIVAASTS
jgi:hypothetical protein